MNTETIWANLAESIRIEKDGTTIPVPVEDIRALINERNEEVSEDLDDEREVLAYIDALAVDGSLSEGARLNLHTMIVSLRGLALEPQAEPPELGHDAGCADFYPEYGAPEGGVCKVCGDMTQGEPSDAQVHAAAVALDPSAWEPGPNYHSQTFSRARDASLDRVRAALRAALSLREGDVR